MNPVAVLNGKLALDKVNKNIQIIDSDVEIYEDVDND